MKILRILAIVLVSSVVFVGCQKSSLTPKNCDSNSEKSGAADNSANRPTGNYSDNSNGNTGSISNDIGGEIYGSGDDDRDGGDKKKKFAK